MAKIKNPSKYQTAIFDEFKNGTRSMAIDAVAGSGKTATVEDMATGLSVNEQPKTLVIAFNKDIRDELQKRVPADIHVKNFHGFGFQAVKNHYGNTKRRWLDDSKYGSIVANMLLEAGHSPEEDAWLFEAVNAAVGMSQLNLIHPIENPEGFDNMCLAYDIAPHKNLGEYVEKALTEGIATARDIISFNDMVYLPIAKNMPLPEYKNVFVDEAQDLSACLRMLALRASGEDGRIIAVGDPRQAIYGFAGADGDSFENIRKASNAIMLPLSVCYRCPTSHIELAQKLVPHIEAAPGAKVGIVEELAFSNVWSKVDQNRKDLVLARMNSPLIKLFFDMMKRGIKARIRGRDVMKTIIAITRQATNNLQNDWLSYEKDLEIWFAAEVDRLKELRNAASRIENLTDKVEACLVVYSAARENGITSFQDMRKFVNNVYSDYETKGSVVLSTIHKAKGLEADHVFFVEPSKIPHANAKTALAKEQENNLKYVALTRSKDTLYMVER